jgi:hypothetical protein
MPKIPKNSTKHNGWTNYETWAVNLWMQNDQASQASACELAKWEWVAAKAEEPHTRSEMARYALAESLEEQHEADAPGYIGVYGDLLNTAQGRINWDEIANALLRGHVAEYEGGAQ